MYSIFGANTGVSTVQTTSVTSVLFYILITVFLVLFILVIIHFTYKPIFTGKTVGGLLSGDSGKIFWESEQRQPGGKISSNEVGIGNRYCEYSLCFDMIIDDPLAGTGANADRPLVRRGAADGSTNNFTMSLHKELNDLQIQVSTMQGSTPSSELFVLENLPTDKGFTIGFVLSETFMEVYLNGRLYSTKTFSGGAKLKDNVGDFYDMMSADKTYGRTKRIRIWNSVVDAATMRTYGGSVSPPFTPKTSYVSGGGCPNN